MGFKENQQNRKSNPNHGLNLDCSGPRGPARAVPDHGAPAVAAARRRRHCRRRAGEATTPRAMGQRCDLILRRPHFAAVASRGLTERGSMMRGVIQWRRWSTGTGSDGRRLPMFLRWRWSARRGSGGRRLPMFLRLSTRRGQLEARLD
jgi:hypothetical protein